MNDSPFKFEVGQPVKYREMGQSSYQETTVAHVGKRTGIVTLKTGDMIGPDRLENIIPIDPKTRLPL